MDRFPTDCGYPYKSPDSDKADKSPEKDEGIALDGTGSSSDSTSGPGDSPTSRDSTFSDDHSDYFGLGEMHMEYDDGPMSLNDIKIEPTWMETDDSYHDTLASSYVEVKSELPGSESIMDESCLYGHTDSEITNERNASNCVDEENTGAHVFPRSSEDYMDDSKLYEKLGREGITPLTEYIEATLRSFSFAAKEKPVFVREASSSMHIQLFEEPLKTFVETIKNGQGAIDPHPYTSRTIILFQSHQGKWVAFFVMYFQEYGNSCPLPNKNSVYISIIDSVQLFEPSSMRRKVFYSSLMCYLEFIQQTTTINSVHLWACPPLPAAEGEERNEYFFRDRPPHQKELPTKFLCYWYVKLMRVLEKVTVIQGFNTLEKWVSSKKTEKDILGFIPLFVGDQWERVYTEYILKYPESIKSKPPQKKRKSEKGHSQPQPLIDLPAYVRDNVMKELKTSKDTFFRMELESKIPAATLENHGVRVVSRIGDRDNWIDYQISNTLSFRDITRAQAATRHLLEALTDAECQIYCDECLKPMWKGMNCPNCDFDQCSDCYVMSRFQHFCSIDWRLEIQKDNAILLKDLPSFLETWAIFKNRFNYGYGNEHSKYPCRQSLEHLTNCVSPPSCSYCKIWARMACSSKPHQWGRNEESNHSTIPVDFVERNQYQKITLPIDTMIDTAEVHYRLDKFLDSM